MITGERGRDVANSPDITANYFATGCLTSLHGGHGVQLIEDAISPNPIYDAARRLAREHVRFIARDQLVGYEVADGRSILRFKRYAYGYKDQKADAFYGMAPPADPVLPTSLIQGETYIVRGAPVNYGPWRLPPGEIFTWDGSLVVPEYGAQLFVLDGIRHIALKAGWTNEWLMGIESRCYGVGEGNEFKPAAFSDYFTYHNRCLFRLNYGEINGRFQRHVDYGYSAQVVDDTATSGKFLIGLNPESVRAGYLSPMAPDGYRYSRGANWNVGSPPSPDFYASCRIYEPPPELDSVRIEPAADGNDIVVVTLTGRLRHHPSAPPVVGPDPSKWSSAAISQLRDEPYRTDDNAMREYVRHLVDPSYQCSIKVGDGAWNAGWPARVFGSCFPVFWFVKLLPMPAAPTPVPIGSRTRAVIDTLLQAEITLRSGCEGFVDKRSTEAINNCTGTLGGCSSDEKGLYDYTFGNLMYAATGQQGIPALPRLIRGDGFSAYGPLPALRLYADTFNALAAGVDLLTRARIELPVQLQQRITTSYGSQRFDSDGLNSDCGSAAGSATWFGALEANPPSATGGTPGTWDTAPGYVAGVTDFSLQFNFSEPHPWQLLTERSVCEWRFAFVDPNAMAAIPETWADMVPRNIGGLFCREEQNTRTSFSGSTIPDCGRPASSITFGCPMDSTTVTTYSCLLSSQGVIDCGPAQRSVVFTGYDASGPYSCHSGWSRAISLTPILGDALTFVEVPLV